MSALLLRALRGEEVERPPVWFMRQAGRFLPEYRELRKRYSLTHLFHTPQLAAEVTEMPIKTLGVDAAILFSDILVITEVLGYTIECPEAGGIFLRPPEGGEKRLFVPEVLHYVKDTIGLLKPRLKVPLIGFCGGPYSVAKYMNRVEPKMLSLLTEISIEYLLMQIEAGVDVVQIFDSWAGELNSDDFARLSLPYLREMVEAVKAKVPVIVFSRGSCHYVDELSALNPTAISFCSERPLAEMRKRVPEGIAVQGNLDPQVLCRGGEELARETEKLLKTMGRERGFIFNLGHGVLPDTPVENALAVIEMCKAAYINSTTR